MLFVHGAYHPAMLDHDRPEEIAAPRVRAVVKKLALYGEGRQNKDGKLPTRTYGWVDLIPADLTVADWPVLTSMTKRGLDCFGHKHWQSPGPTTRPVPGCSSYAPTRSSRTANR
jgi:hypothetical protein